MAARAAGAALGGSSGGATATGSNRTGSSLLLVYDDSLHTAVEATGHRLAFRSIDPWLDGICVSHCPTCSWGEQRAADCAAPSWERSTCSAASKERAPAAPTAEGCAPAAFR